MERNDKNAITNEEKREELDYLLGSGQITLADYVGLDKKQLYRIARQAYQLLESGKVEEARVIYQGLVAADPFDSVFHCHLGSILVRQNKHDEALEHFNQAINFNLANIDALVARGEIFLSRGDVNAAVDDLKKAIEFEKDGTRGSVIRAKAILYALRDALEKQAGGNASKSAS